MCAPAEECFECGYFVSNMGGRGNIRLCGYMGTIQEQFREEGNMLYGARLCPPSGRIIPEEP